MKVACGNFHRLVYCSRARLGTRQSIDDAMSGILQIAQARNSACDVTGALLVCNGWFVQVLEGPMQAVLQTYGRITRDPRHDGLTILEATPTRDRHFAEWSMCGLGFLPVDREIVDVLAAGGAFDPTKLSAARALNLLTSIGKMQRTRATASL